MSFRPRGELKRQRGPTGLGVLEERDWRGQMTFDEYQSPRKGRQMWYYRNKEQPKDKEVFLCCWIDNLVNQGKHQNRHKDIKS